MRYFLIGTSCYNDDFGNGTVTFGLVMPEFPDFETIINQPTGFNWIRTSLIQVTSICELREEDYVSFFKTNESTYQ